MNEELPSSILGRTNLRNELLCVRNETFSDLKLRIFMFLKINISGNFGLLTDPMVTVCRYRTAKPKNSMSSMLAVVCMFWFVPPEFPLS